MATEHTFEQYLDAVKEQLTPTNFLELDPSEMDEVYVPKWDAPSTVRLLRALHARNVQPLIAAGCVILSDVDLYMSERYYRDKYNATFEEWLDLVVADETARRADLDRIHGIQR